MIKVLHLRHAGLDDTWLLSIWTLATRCLVAALVLAIFCFRSLRGITRAEWLQGLGLAATGGPGLYLQADGLASTDASTSAFLTQFYCVLLPLWACLRWWRLPSWRILFCTLCVLWGMKILSGFNLETMKLGVGESRTLLATLFFTGQILLLEVPKFSGNRSITITIISLALTGIGAAACAVPVTPDWAGMMGRWLTGPNLFLLTVITLGCTLFSYVMMNHWQRHVSATEAGLIYCMEPVFTAVYALFLPSMMAKWARVSYPDETLTSSLLIGGMLVTIANIVLQLPAATTKPKEE